MLLKDKTILITGASKGIGKAIAEKFAANGAQKLILCARNLEALEQLKAALEDTNSCEVHVFKCDVAEQADIKNLFEQIKLAGLSIDVLVNNAGIMKDAALIMASYDLYQQNFNTNVAGTVFMTQYAVKHFIRKRSGSVINFTSIVGIQGSPGQSIYAASKAAITGLTKSLSKEFAPFNVRVNAIAPGFIETDMTGHFNDEQREKIINNIGFKRGGRAEEVAEVALFLASDMSSYVTGQILGVDGGMII